MIVLIALFLLGGIGFATKDRSTVAIDSVENVSDAIDVVQSTEYSVIVVPTLTCGCPAAPSVELSDQNVLTTESSNNCSISTQGNKATCGGTCTYTGTLANGKTIKVRAACGWS